MITDSESSDMSLDHSDQLPFTHYYTLPIRRCYSDSICYSAYANLIVRDNNTIGQDERMDFLDSESSSSIGFMGSLTGNLKHSTAASVSSTSTSMDTSVSSSMSSIITINTRTSIVDLMTMSTSATKFSSGAVEPEEYEVLKEDNDDHANIIDADADN